MVTVRTVQTDVLIVGGGGAGVRAAIAADDAGSSVAMLVKVQVAHSGLTSMACPSYQAAMSLEAIYPDGRKETVLSAKFNFHWQLGYEVEKPIKVTKGTRMLVAAHHDNSATNPSNPAPEQNAMWGEMTSQEMMLPWFGVVVPRAAQPDKIASYRPGDFDPNLRRPGPPRVRPGVPVVQPAVLR